MKLKDFSTKLRILKSKVGKDYRLRDVIRSVDDSTMIYINNHVTPFFGKLLSEGRRLVKEKKIHSVWLSMDGRRLRFGPDGEERIYHSANELHALTSSGLTRSDEQQSRKEVQVV